MVHIIEFKKENKQHNDIIDALTRRNKFYPDGVRNFIKTTETYNGVLVLENTKVCGFMFWLDAYGIDRRVININYILIDKKYRGKGYGRRLINVFNDEDISCIGIKATRASVPFWVNMGYWFNMQCSPPKTIEEKNNYLSVWKEDPAMYDMMISAVMDPYDSGLIGMFKARALTFQEIYENAKKHGHKTI